MAVFTYAKHSTVKTIVLIYMIYTKRYDPWLKNCNMIQT